MQKRCMQTCRVGEPIAPSNLHSHSHSGAGRYVVTNFNLCPGRSTPRARHTSRRRGREAQRTRETAAHKLQHLRGLSLVQPSLQPSRQHLLSHRSKAWAGAPFFPLSIYFLIFSPFYFSLSFIGYYLFSSFVHPFPFYQNSQTPFPGWRS